LLRRPGRVQDTREAKSQYQPLYFIFLNICLDVHAERPCLRLLDMGKMYVLGAR